MAFEHQNQVATLVDLVNHSLPACVLTSARLLIWMLAFLCNLSAQQPFQVDSLFDKRQPETLGLAFVNSLETITIFAPDSVENRYNHGVVLFPFKGKLYAQWQSAKEDEDAPDTQVFYSCSEDERQWSRPVALTEKWTEGIRTSGGWWGYEDTLVAYINCWPNSENGVKEGYAEYLFSVDGFHWHKGGAVMSASGKAIPGIIEQDVHALPNGRIVTAFHLQPGLKATPFYTDDPSGIRGWKAGDLPHLPGEPTMSREIEPSWFRRKDSCLVMVFRDQQSSFKKLASVSCDQGLTWTLPELVNTPDSRAKQSAGNLPDGTAFMVNNPTENKNRFPLVITLSPDGCIFNKAFLLRSGGSDLQPMRFSGKYKRPGYSYPKSVVWGDFLYVGYATNKEDVELTRVPLSVLGY